MVCDKCGHDIQCGEWPWCPHPAGVSGVAGDECDILIRHGICNEDGSPKRYRSKSELKKAAFEAGLSVYGETPRLNQRIVESEALKRGKT